MDNSIKNVEIQNFKSIKDLTFYAKRINVFIGKPNVGKSNILEALTLLGAGYTQVNNDGFLKDLIRFEETSNLFYDDNINKDIIINTENYIAFIKHYDDDYKKYYFIHSSKSKWVENLITIKNSNKFVNNFLENAKNDKNINHYSIKPVLTDFPETLTFDKKFRENYNSPFKKYDYKKISSISNKSPNYLLPPNGSNLFWIVYHNKVLSKEIAFILNSYGLQFTLYQKEGKFEIEKKDGLLSYKYPYSSLADTLQRLIFYFAAIDSNENSILILEEPEVHSFPPYTQSLGYRIVNDYKNQYFITTHSPYLLETLLDNSSEEDLNVYLTYYENYETKLKLLNQSELDDLNRFGYDVFFNLHQLLEAGKLV